MRIGGTDGMYGRGTERAPTTASGRAALVNPELHRPETARIPESTPPPPPDAAKLALVNQELHRPPTSLGPTPGIGPGFGSNPALEPGKTRDMRDGSLEGVDTIV